jgi:N-dimethylarginine dimethylaminohydrolase
MPILDEINELKKYPFSAGNIPRNVLMVTPEYYGVEYVINPHMKTVSGELPLVDENRALFQWEKLKEKIEELGLKVSVIGGKEGLPDMVFSANQILPLDSKRVLASKMATKQREDEVKYFKGFFQNHGKEVKELPADVEKFEGTGDGIWHHGMELLWIGHGLRSSYSAIEYLGDDLGLPVVPLKLVDEHFYHLDTCMAIIDSKTVVWTPKAFSNESQKLIDDFFPITIEIPYEEAKNHFSCNCWSVDGKNVITPINTPILKSKLESHGFQVHEIDTSEFLKSGGSVFCLKLAYY